MKKTSSASLLESYLRGEEGYLSVHQLINLYIIELPQPNQQHKTKQNNLVGVVLLSVKKTTPHHSTTMMWLHFKQLPGNLGSRFFVCSLILTQLEEIWKTTSIFLKMEDDLNSFLKEDDLCLNYIPLHSVRMLGK